MRKLYVTLIILLMGTSPLLGAWTGTTADKQISFDDNEYANTAKIAATPNGFLHIFWHEDNPSNDDVHYGRSYGGDNWFSENGDYVLNIPDNDYVSPQGIDNCVDKDGNIFVVWSEDAPDINEIWLTKSTENGLTWSGFTDTIFVSNPNTVDEPANYPSIAADRNGVLHCVWNQAEPVDRTSEIHYSRSFDSGESWSGRDADLYISSPGVDYASFPDIACDVWGNIFVVWRQATGTDSSQIHYLVSHDGGDTWNNGQDNVIGYPMKFTLDPEIAIDPVGNLHVVWRGSMDLISPIHYEIYYTGSDDNGLSWNGIDSFRRISYRQASGNSTHNQEIACDRYGNIFVVWQEEQIGLNSEIHLSTSTDMGTTWSGENGDEIISFPDGEQGYRPFPVGDMEGNIHVVWTEFNGSTPDNYEVHYSRSDPYGYTTPGQLGLYPINAPILVPQGGIMQFSIAVVNNTEMSGTATGWLGLKLPGGGVVDSLSAADISLDGGDVAIFDSLNLAVPGSAPLGVYTMYAKLGFYPNFVIAEDSFQFIVDVGVEGSNEWLVTGFGKQIPGDGYVPSTTGINVKAYPNPFNASTTIEFDLPRPSQVTVTVYNLLGENIRSLVDGDESTGKHAIIWDGKDASGKPVASGVYFYRFEVSDHSETKKMLLLK
ncbi:MAG: T9SS type A sorting domain-containing protein [candidate division Zixibacteria bacterium]|nr:T9SS type A sorting domain-containing protein [candidate division Zixibacteria bacterium]